MKQIKLDNLAPEPIQGHTSKGDQPKWHIGNDWYKADHMGYEGLCETLISSLLPKTSIADFVAYTPVAIDYDGRVRPGCVSPNFRKKDEILIPLERLHRAYMGVGLAKAIASLEDAAKRILYTVDFVERTTGLRNVGAWLTAILELDALFLNEDRHTNNLAVIRNETTMTYRLCPIFDNGLTLLSDLQDYPLDRDVYTCISRVQAKPFATDFYEQAFAASHLYGSQLHCSFSKTDVTAVLESMSDLYDMQILSRTETVVFEQMRKYRIFFG